MNKNWIIIGSVLVVALGVGYWYWKSNEEKDTEPLTSEDKDTISKIEIV